MNHRRYLVYDLVVHVVLRSPCDVSGYLYLCILKGILKIKMALKYSWRFMLGQQYFGLAMRGTMFEKYVKTFFSPFMTVPVNFWWWKVSSPEALRFYVIIWVLCNTTAGNFQFPPLVNCWWKILIPQRQKKYPDIFPVGGCLIFFLHLNWLRKGIFCNTKIIRLSDIYQLLLFWNKCVCCSEY